MSSDVAGADVVVQVAPDENLVSGDVVTVTASGFGGDGASSVFICELPLGPAPPSPDDCGAPAGTAPTDENGVLDVPYTVQRFLYPASQPQVQVDCAVETCGIALAEPVEGGNLGDMFVAAISFRPGPVPRPDAMIKTREVDSRLIINDFYTNQLQDQQVSHSIVPGGTWSFALRMQNDGEATDDLIVKFRGGGSSFADPGIRLFVGYYDVLAFVLSSSGFVFENVPVGETRAMAVQFRAPPTATSGQSSHLDLALSSGAAFEVTDWLRVGVRVP